jgi:hypothetical protein
MQNGSVLFHFERLQQSLPRISAGWFIRQGARPLRRSQKDRCPRGWPNCQGKERAE